MARERNYLLGNGERLTSRVEISKGGGDKNPPYPFAQARVRLADQISAFSTSVRLLPEEACPGNEAVVALTMHPRYLSKSDFPSKLLNALGLRPLGTKLARVAPENWGIEKHPDTAVADQIFVAGSRDRLSQLDRFVSEMVPASPGASDLAHVEEISFPSPPMKMRLGDAGSDEKTLLEVVLHNRGRVDILKSFTEYASQLSAEVRGERSRVVGGLTFVPVFSPPGAMEDLAQFSFVRLLRTMPAVGAIPMSVIRTTALPIVMPTENSLSDSTRALIFDGGIPHNARSELSQWVNLIEPASVGPANAEDESHGLAVTSAFLFGPIISPAALNRPICSVDHVRVLDDYSDYYDVLDRMLEYYDATGHQYDFLNISLGPRMPVEDDDVTRWTAEWDSRLSLGDCVVSVAAGNDGEMVATPGLNRIQPPSDGVNVLTVGACDRMGETWARAPYSCIGPGRRPGYRKPDGVAFGGSDVEPFRYLGDGSLEDGTGTSLAAPYALRLAASIKAQLGSSIDPLAVRALMIHRATNASQHPESEIGWGRFEVDPTRLITCDDMEALVLYQGELTATEYLRAQIPFPEDLTSGLVDIEATLVIATEVDPAHASAYTRRGVEVFFRPHAERFGKGSPGKPPQHPKTAPFLSAGGLYGRSEALLRENGFKWEPCRRAKVTRQASTLFRPCFDIYHHHRADGVASNADTTTKYALAVTVKAKGVSDFYNRIVRAYSHVLIPLQPTIRIEV